LIAKIFHYLQSNKSKAVLIAIVWTAFILLACFIPGSTIPKVNIPLIDKWVHFIIFAGFTFLWYCVANKISFTNSILLIIIASLLGYTVEIIQGSGLVKNRNYETNDIIADAIGGILGVIIFLIFHSKFSKK
jgi:VanZ family protein